MTECEITGQAVVQQSFPMDPTEGWGRTLAWLQADEEIHVSTQLIGDMDPDAWAFLTAKYEIYGWCGYQEDTRHARLKDTP